MAHTKFDCQVLTPEGEAFSGEVEMVSTRTGVGSLGILANHAPLMGMLEPTELRLYKTESDIKDAGGVCPDHKVPPVRRSEPCCVRAARYSSCSMRTVAPGAVVVVGCKVSPFTPSLVPATGCGVLPCLEVISLAN